MGGVGSVGVVVEPPVLDDHAGFEEAVEAPRVEQLVAESSVEGLDPGVLPWRAGVDEHRPGAVEAAPVVDGVRDELGTIVEAHVDRRTALHGEAVQDRNDGVGIDGAIDLDREALAGELVDHVEHLQGAAVGGGVELEVHRPDHVRSDR